MREHEMPTHLNVEDRMFWRLTARQVAILATGAACAYWTWRQVTWLPTVLSLGLTALVVLATLALALVQPSGRGLEEWALTWLRYAAMPSRSSWRVEKPTMNDTGGSKEQELWTPANWSAER